MPVLSSREREVPFITRWKGVDRIEDTVESIEQSRERNFQQVSLANKSMNGVSIVGNGI